MHPGKAKGKRLEASSGFYLPNATAETLALMALVAPIGALTGLCVHYAIPE